MFRSLLLSLNAVQCILISDAHDCSAFLSLPVICCPFLLLTRVNHIAADRFGRREIITVRGQSYFSRLPKYVPPAFVAGGGHTRRVETGVGGQYFVRCKTQLCTLPISNPFGVHCNIVNF